MKVDVEAEGQELSPYTQPGPLPRLVLRQSSGVNGNEPPGPVLVSGRHSGLVNRARIFTRPDVHRSVWPLVLLQLLPLSGDASVTDGISLDSLALLSTLSSGGGMDF